jgi:hypothetical protein
VKALKPSKKFNSGGSGLSLTEKAAAAKVKNGRGKMSSTSAGFGGVGGALKALDLFNLGSSASNAEAATPVLHKKCPMQFPPSRLTRKLWMLPLGKIYPC